MKYIRPWRGPRLVGDDDMQAVHAAGGMLLLGVTGVYALAALVLIVAGGAGRAWFEWARRVLTFLLLLQLGLGVLLYATGDRPAEGIHVLYGALVVGVLPLAHSFSSEAPAAARAGVLAVGAVITLGLLWRLLTTGGG